MSMAGANNTGEIRYAGRQYHLAEALVKVPVKEFIYVERHRLHTGAFFTGRETNIFLCSKKRRKVYTKGDETNGKAAGTRQMKVKLKLRPNDPGTKKLTAKYGNRLLCVRYRYDAENNRRITSVELIEEEIPWKRRTPDDKQMSIKIQWDETELQEKAKAAGGRWDPIHKVWILPYGIVRKLKLQNRIL
jgi:hypothetical protein